MKQEVHLPSYRVALVDTLEGFRSIRDDWESLSSLDRDANSYLSWDWLHGAFQSNPARWSVLTVRSRGTNALLGGLPLKYRIHWSKSKQQLQTELECGTRLLGGPYAGMLVDPSCENLVLRKFVSAMRVLPWVRIKLKYLPQEHRAMTLAKAFSSLDCTVRGNGRIDRSPQQILYVEPRSGPSDRIL